MDEAIQFLVPLFILSLAIETLQEWLDPLVERLAGQWESKGPFGDIVDVDKIKKLADITDEIKAKLSDDLQKKVETPPTDPKEVEKLLQEAREYLKKRNKEEKKKSKRAVTLFLSFLVGFVISAYFDMHIVTGVVQVLGENAGAMFGKFNVDTKVLENVPAGVEHFVAALVLAGGTETTNSIVKFLGYKKDKTKEDGDGSESPGSGQDNPS